jgi:hypothetical protein
MSWLFSQVLVEEFLEENFWDGELYAELNVMPTQHKFWRNDKMMEFLNLSQFGLTLQVLTESRGRELLTWYLAVSHAKTLAQQEKAQELQVKEVDYGQSSPELLARLDPDTLLWRTAQCSLLEDLELSLQTFPRWGSMLNGALYPLPMLVQTISVKEFGSEPNNETFFHTPNTTGMDGGSNSRKALKKRMWLTPRVLEVDESPENFRRRMNSKRPNDRKDGFGSLTMQVKAMQKLPTPDASSRGPTKNYDPKAKSQSGRTLQSFVAKWPTPMSSEHKANRQTRENHQNGLTQAVLATETGGQLNPTWVEWLMGWPLGWTDLKPLEMDKSHYVQQQLGSC